MDKLHSNRRCIQILVSLPKDDRYILLEQFEILAAPDNNTLLTLSCLPFF